MTALRRLAGGADRFAVVDTETTGVYPTDRVVEIAIVTVSLDGEVLDRWDTLVQPGRDITATHIHGITASMVADAPTWGEIAGDVGVRLHDACLVAHNAHFDIRMISGEYKRCDSELVVPAWVDTMVGACGRLPTMCAMHGIELEGAHRALFDALACAKLLAAIADGCDSGGPASVTVTQRSGRVLRREDTTPVQLPDPPLIRYLATRLDHAGLHDRTVAYLDLVGRAVSDVHLDPEERRQLSALAQDLGLTAAHVAQAHRRYVNDLVDAALADHILTPDEYDELLRVATALGVDSELVDQRTRSYRATSTTIQMVEGLEVVFTGDDPYLPRVALEAHAEKLGLVVAPGGVRKSTGLLVAYDVESRSNKAKKAAHYNIPVISTAAFAELQAGDSVECGAADETLVARKVIECSHCRATWTVPASERTRREQRCTRCVASS